MTRTGQVLGDGGPLLRAVLLDQFDEIGIFLGRPGPLLPCIEPASTLGRSIIGVVVEAICPPQVMSMLLLRLTLGHLNSN